MDLEWILRGWLAASDDDFLASTLDASILLKLSSTKSVAFWIRDFWTRFLMSIWSPRLVFVGAGLVAVSTLRSRV